MADDWVTDCSGCRVPVGDKLYTARCWVGNTDDYLKDNADHVIPGSLDWAEPAPTCLMMPIYRSGAGFLPTVASLLSQNWPPNSDIEQFLRFKFDLETAVLTPRGAAVGELFHLPGIEIGTAYADQIWFAMALPNKERLMVNVETTIEEEEYPSNAAMTARLAAYLETGGDRGALEIFENLRVPYSSSCCGRYGLEDVERLLAVLETRDIAQIEATVRSLG